MGQKKRPQPPRPPRPAILEMAESMIATREQIYRVDRDPFRVWEAYWLAAQYAPWGIAMPEWVSSYLARVARDLIDISRNEPTGKALPAAISRALEINGRGRGAVFARRDARRTAQQYAVDVITLIRRGHKPYKAIDYVAEIHKVNRSTVERAYQRVRVGGFLWPGGWEGPPHPSKAARDS